MTLSSLKTIATVNNGTRLVKSPEYESGMDSTERMVVSYLLGMTQAHLVATKARGYTHTADIDRVFAIENIKRFRGGKRSDLLAVDMSHTPHSIEHATWEAKGTSGDFLQSTMTKALTQAKNTPTIPRVTLEEKVASVASFKDGRGYWQSHLEDPEDDAGETPFGIEGFLYGYYRPFVDAADQLGDADSNILSGQQGMSFEIPGVPVTVSVPGEIIVSVNALRSMDSRSRNEAGLITSALAELTEYRADVSEVIGPPGLSPGLAAPDFVEFQESDGFDDWWDEVVGSSSDDPIEDDSDWDTNE